MATPARFPVELVAAALVGALVRGSCAPAPRTAAAASAPPTRAAQVTRPPSTNDLAPNMVWMGDHYFSPSSLTVKVGSMVTSRMLGSQEHDVWSLDGSFHSPTMGPGSIYTHTFTKVGTFKYICLPHNGDGMYGEIIVVP
ncbi:MAG TPA: plastocyanin/azurin family copper-binding protein [Candidatus Limnocylindria bacterium]|nr:plastocyanin/azurin family copper-binding protein [Candidatus Limnocylindria bacterium]